MISGMDTNLTAVVIFVCFLGLLPIIAVIGSKITGGNRVLGMRDKGPTCTKNERKVVDSIIEIRKAIGRE